MGMPRELLDELASIFRGVAQRRRRGLVFVEGEDVRWEICCSGIRILEVRGGGVDIGQEVLRRLVGAGVMKALPEVEAGAELKVVFESAVGAGLVLAEEFREALRCIELNVLHSLRRLARAQCGFEMRGMDVMPELSMDISASELLLNLADFESVEARFKRVGALAPGATVCVSGDQQVELSGERDTRLWNTVQKRVEIGEMSRRVMLSDFEIMRLIGEWAESGVVKIEEGARPAAPVKPVPVATAAIESQVPIEEGDGAAEPASQGEDVEPAWEPMEEVPAYAEPLTVERAAGIVSLIFLVVLVVFLPSVLNSWFATIFEYSSRSVGVHDRIRLSSE